MLRPAAREELAIPLKERVEKARDELAPAYKEQFQAVREEQDPEAKKKHREELNVTYRDIAILYTEFTERVATCDFVGEQSPVSNQDERFVRKLAKRALAPSQPWTQKAARRNKAASRHLAYYNPGTEYDALCWQVARGKSRIHPAALRLVLDQFNVGYPEAGFFPDRLKFHNQGKGLVQNPTNFYVPHPYVNRIEYAAFHAAHHRYKEMFGPSMKNVDYTDRLIGIALSLEHGLMTVNPTNMKDDPVQQFRLARLLRARTPGVYPEQLEMVLPIQWRKKADRLILENEHLIKRADALPMYMAKTLGNWAITKTNPYVDQLAERFKQRQQAEVETGALPPPEDVLASEEEA